MGEAGWDLSAVQSAELLLDPGYLRETAERSGIALLGGNILSAEGEPLFPASKVFQLGDRRLGVLAVYDPKDQTGRSRVDKSLRFADPALAVREGVRELRESCDAVVVLYGGKRDSALKACDTVEGIDLVLFGISNTSQRVPTETSTGTPLYTAAPQGKDFGEIVLTFTDEGGVRLSPFTVHELTLEVKEDPAVAARVAEFLVGAKSRKAQKDLLRQEVAEFSDMEVGDAFLGSERCRDCHGPIHAVNEGTAHWRAIEGLVERFQENNPDCVGCHVTGWGMPGGFGQSGAERFDLDRVQCEACHGYGTAHSRDGSMLQSARASCAACHRPDIPDDCGGARRPFDYDRAWKKIAHLTRTEEDGPRTAFLSPSGTPP